MTEIKTVSLSSTTKMALAGGLIATGLLSVPLSASADTHTEPIVVEYGSDFDVTDYIDGAKTETVVDTSSLGAQDITVSVDESVQVIVTPANILAYDQYVMTDSPFDPLAGVQVFIIENNEAVDLTGDLEVSGAVDASVPGTYTLEYSVELPDGTVLKESVEITVGDDAEAFADSQFVTEGIQTEERDALMALIEPDEPVEDDAAELEDVPAEDVGSDVEAEDTEADFDDVTPPASNDAEAERVTEYSDEADSVSDDSNSDDTPAVDAPVEEASVAVQPAVEAVAETAVVDGGRGNGGDANAAEPQVTPAVERVPMDRVIDGNVVAIESEQPSTLEMAKPAVEPTETPADVFNGIHIVGDDIKPGEYMVTLPEGDYGVATLKVFDSNGSETYDFRIGVEPGSAPSAEVLLSDGDRVEIASDDETVSGLVFNPLRNTMVSTADTVNTDTTPESAGETVDTGGDSDEAEEAIQVLPDTGSKVPTAGLIAGFFGLIGSVFGFRKFMG